MQKIQSASLVAFILYEYGDSDASMIERVEAFSSSAITFWLRIKDYDLKIIEEKFRDKQNSVYLTEYASAFDEVLKLKDIAVRQGAYQRKH